MTPEEMEAKEKEEFNTGPLKVLTDSVRTTHKSSSTAETTKNCWGGSRPSTGIATWSWRESRRCGQSYPKLGRERRKQSQSTRIASSQKCSSGETQSFSS